MRGTTLSLGVAVLVAASAPVAAQQKPAETEVRAVVEAFDRALASGDSAAVMAQLHADATVYEAGHAETREQYRAGHLAGDIAFLRDVRSETTSDHVTVTGDMALYRSEYRMQGRYRDRDVNRTGVETMVLTRTPDGWKILHIHWSSR